MNKQTKNPVLVGIIILLLSACGQLETAPAHAETFEPIGVVTEGPIDNPTPVSSGPAFPGKTSKYIGLNFPPYPDGLTEVFAMLIQDAEDHSLSLVSEGADNMLWLSRLTHLDSNGNAFWEVKDILDLSDLESGLVLLPDGCSLHGEPDNEILVVGREGVILLAWRANTTSNVFEVISTEGIECHSDKAVSLE